MFTKQFILIVLLNVVLGELNPIPLDPPLWPYPKSISSLNYHTPPIISQNSVSFVNRSPFSSSTLTSAFKRYKDYIFFTSSEGNSPFQLSVYISSQDTTLNSTTDESYTFVNNQTNADIHAETIYGALRGLETFSQIIWYDNQNFIIPWSCTISDNPHFSHRGLLIDTARHYLPLSTIKKAIDSLSFSKMNVLHWHIVDAESFPFISKKEVELSKGAWNEKLTYNGNDVIEIVEYAKERGVRVIPEFDTPGHSASWGIGYPDIVAKCPSWSSNVNNVPLNPAINETLQVVENLFLEVDQYIQDDFWHIGGDEVVYQCFAQDPAIQQWMKDHNYQSFNSLMLYYENFLFDFFKTKMPNNQKKTKNNSKTLIAWEEVFSSYGIQSNLPKDLIIEVWKDEQTLLEVAKNGFRGILAYGWYLDHRAENWKDFYDQKVFSSPYWTNSLKKFIIGGEVSAWAEYLNQYTFETQVNTRLFAAAEVLYKNDSSYPPNPESRLSNFICSLERRGIHSSPLSPGYCLTQ